MSQFIVYSEMKPERWKQVRVTESLAVAKKLADDNYNAGYESVVEDTVGKIVYDAGKPKQNPAPKRKTRATTQSAAESYVRRPSQATRKPPSARLKKRRTINLRMPVGVFPNPSPRDSAKLKKNPVLREKISGPKNFIVQEGALSEKAAFKTVAVFEKVNDAFDYAKARDAKNQAENKRRWIRVLEG